MGLQRVRHDLVTFTYLSLPCKQTAAAAAAKALQSCPTLCDPRDGSPPGSPVPGIASGKLLCSTGSSAQSSVMTRWWGWRMGGEEGSGERG